MTVAISVILAAIAGTLHWKRRVPRGVAFMLALAGLGLSAVILKYIGAFTNMTVLGVGVVTLGAIIGLIVFWEEAVKKNGLHRVRTPIVAVLLGVCLASTGGAIGSLAHSVSSTGGQNLDKSVTTLFGHKG
jgi:integral membrane sensor domain MASE1